MLKSRGAFNSLPNVKKLIKKNNQIGTVMLINFGLALIVLSKEIFLAAYLGTSPEADAFLLAYFIPDTVGNNLLASALAVACVPVFARLYADNHHVRLRQTIIGLTLYATAFAFLLLVIAYVMRDLIIGGLGAGFNQETLSLTIELLEIILPSMMIYPLIGIGIASLQVHNNFKIPALAPVFFNLFWVGTLLYVELAKWPIEQGVYVLAAAIPGGTLIVVVFVWVNERITRLGRKQPIGQVRQVEQLGKTEEIEQAGQAEQAEEVVQACQMGQFEQVGQIGSGEQVKIQKSKFGASKRIDSESDYVDFLRGFFPYLFILLFSQVVYFVERYLAGGLGEGTVAGLNYAYRLAQFPLWVFVAAISAVVFPAMAKAMSLGRMEEVQASFAKALTLVLVIALPLTIVFFGMREPIVSLLLQRGSFGPESVEITTEIIAGYALAIVWQGLIVLGLRLCLAMGQAKIALSAGLVAAVVNILLDIILVKTWGAAGLGYGAALGAMVNCGILYFLLARVPGFDLSLRRQPVLRKIVLANLPIVVVTWGLAKVWLNISPDAGVMVRYGYGLLAAVILIVIWDRTLRKLNKKYFLFK